MVQWFADDPKQPFSLHRIAHAGLKYGKNVGEWFGPSTMAQVLEYGRGTRFSSSFSLLTLAT